ncbi:MAG: phosphoribosylglycinamide formyltransferase [Candidatus Tectomicrobia bacterium]|uniref:Phosphoribosylglycinamide formyltransferase n=1 Tax=Tectimicrobiota bacterium TaxID=2528274 RepID=A0A932FW62_UNCTE|nr:phosphoribosylglycinamide formyltransferase [Candidatus Tectomicrobia bacterium]
MNRGAVQRLKVAVLASGRGSNLQAIIDAVESGRLEATISFVLSDREDALALQRARQHQLEAIYLDPRRYPHREEFERTLLELLEQRQVELVCLAGFMRILSPYLLQGVRGKVMNIHPSLLPAFPGLRAQRKALEYGVRFSGCTVHFVDEGVDTGPIITQATVPVLEDDTEESLSARILVQEHQIYPQAIQWYAEGRLRIEGRRVILSGEREQGIGERG